MGIIGDQLLQPLAGGHCKERGGLLLCATDMLWGRPSRKNNVQKTIGLLRSSPASEWTIILGKLQGAVPDAMQKESWLGRADEAAVGVRVENGNERGA